MRGNLGAPGAEHQHPAASQPRCCCLGARGEARRWGPTVAAPEQQNCETPNRHLLFLCSNRAGAGVGAAAFCCCLHGAVEASQGALAGLGGDEGYGKRAELSTPAAPGCWDLPHAKHPSWALACRG